MKEIIYDEATTIPVRIQGIPFTVDGTTVEFRIPVEFYDYPLLSKELLAKFDDVVLYQIHRAVEKVMLEVQVLNFLRDHLEAD